MAETMPNSDLCIRTKKIFTHEHATYPPDLLAYHLPSIHPRGQPQEQENLDIEVHPMCEFCHECTAGDDELYGHMRENHEECFICKQNGTLYE